VHSPFLTGSRKVLTERSPRRSNVPERTYWLYGSLVWRRRSGGNQSEDWMRRVIGTKKEALTSIGKATARFAARPTGVGNEVAAVRRRDSLRPAAVQASSSLVPRPRQARRRPRQSHQRQRLGAVRRGWAVSSFTSDIATTMSSAQGTGPRPGQGSEQPAGRGHPSRTPRAQRCVRLRRAVLKQAFHCAVYTSSEYRIDNAQGSADPELNDPPPTSTGRKILS